MTALTQQQIVSKLRTLEQQTNNASFAFPLTPPMFGAKGNGADDTTALRNMFAAAGSTGAVIDLGCYDWQAVGTITLSGNMSFTVRAASMFGGSITNRGTNTSVFTLTSAANLNRINWENITINSQNGGHIFDGTAGPYCSFWKWNSVYLNQQHAGYSIWSQSGGLFIDCAMGDDSFLVMAPGASVSAWKILNIAGNVNSNRWSRLRCTNGTLANPGTQPFFNIDPGSVAGWNQELRWEHITWEVCKGGAIWVTGAYDVRVDQCAFWDITATSDIYHFGKSTAGYFCIDVNVKGGMGGIASAGNWNVYCDPGCLSVHIEDFSAAWATAPQISSPAGQTTLVNVMGSTGLPVTQIPGLSASGSGSCAFGTVAANSVAVATVTVTGAAVGSAVSLGLPGAFQVPVLSGIVFSAYVGSANTVTVLARNNTAGAISVGTGTMKCVVM